LQPDLTPFARRLVPARPDLASEHLRAEVEAERYEPGVNCIVSVPILDLALRPEPEAGLATQLLHGEPFRVFEDRGDGLAWGQSGWDGYVGYVASAGLAMADALDAGHWRRVTARSSHVYSRPDIKATVQCALPALAEVDVRHESGAFCALAGGGFIPAAHLEPVRGDAVDHARRYLGAPYLWGGRSATGIDCSALVQLAFRAAGHDGVPRDSDMQATLFGTPLPLTAEPGRGDLLLWPGHVGICTGEGGLVHANAYHMEVVEEPLAEAKRRIEETGGGPPTGLRRVMTGD
jgi:cell wall-associated NlpC family hydrolase